jgi:type I protein arginine methyltransferase
MFCVKHGGAKKVYAVDCSNIASQAKQIIEDNGFADMIEVFHGKMEEINLPEQHVDIIVSEWMV